MTERFIAGIAGAPFGLDGRIKIQSLSGEEDHILALKKAVFRGLDGVEREYAVEAAFRRPFSLKLAGINSPEAAKTLKGAEILVNRADAAPLNKGEFYIEDLKGLAVYLRAGDVSAAGEVSTVGGTEAAAVGEITGMIEGGGGFLAELTLKNGKKHLVPFRNEFFGDIDLEKGRAELLESWILDED